PPKEWLHGREGPRMGVEHANTLRSGSLLELALSLRSYFSRRDGKRTSWMGSTAAKVKGSAKEAMRQVKQGAGEATVSDKMKREGAFQESNGDFQKGVGKAKDALKHAAHEATSKD